MSDPGPSRFGAGDPDPDTDGVDELDQADGTDEVPERNVVLRTLTRVRALIVLVPLVAVVLVAASIGANKLWADIPEGTIVGPDVTCWDGRTAPILDCGEPRGQRGLRWVFPSFQPKDERCVRTDSPAFDVACSVRFLQRPVVITYAARPSGSRLVDAVRKSYGNRPVTEADGERVVFRDSRVGEDGLYRTTVVYADHPFAVTVEAPAPDLRDDALDELVDFRPADQVVVRP